MTLIICFGYQSLQQVKYLDSTENIIPAFDGCPLPKQVLPPQPPLKAPKTRLAQDI